MAQSLKALQAFEAAARTGSFVAAAQELSVTPAAVSQLVRALESQCGRKLFVRIHRGIVPSEAGLEILPRLSAVFSELSVVDHQLSGSVLPSQLTVSVPPSIATGWLARRLTTFLENAPALDITLRSDEDPVAFEHDRIDIRMSYGPFHYRGHRTTEVLRDALYAVCSPVFVARHGPFDSANALLDVLLVHTDWGPSAATFPSWRQWFETMGVSDLTGRRRRGPLTNSSKVALDLARDGLGIALCQGLLVAGPIARGELVLPLPGGLPLSQPYCLTVSANSKEHAAVQQFESWFHEDCRQTIWALPSATTAC